jgi:TonB family protein
MLKLHQMIRTSLAALLLASVSCQTTSSASSTSTLSAYKADFYQRMNTVWMRLVSAHAQDVSFGTAKVAFHVLPDGSVKNVRVTSNTGNAALAQVALETVRTTRLPPLPAALLPKLTHGYLPAENIAFKVYPQR